MKNMFFLQGFDFIEYSQEHSLHLKKLSLEMFDYFNSLIFNS